MAMTTANVKQTLVKVFAESILAKEQDWLPIFNVYTDDVAALRLGSLVGASTVPTWAGNVGLTTTSPDALSDAPPAGGSALTLTYNMFGLQVRINRYDLKDIPSISSIMAAKLAGAVANRMRQTAWGSVSNSFAALAQPMYDNLALCDGNHTVSTASGGPNRSNLLVAALTRAAFEANIALMRNFRNFDSVPYDVVDSGRLYLIVGPDLESAAREIVGSPFALGGSGNSQGEINVQKGRATVIVSNQLADANDWFLVQSAETPFNFWTRGAPLFDVSTDEDTKELKLSVTMAITAQAGPSPIGIVGNQVP